MDDFDEYSQNEWLAGWVDFQGPRLNDISNS